MKCRCDSDKRAFFDGQTAKYSALDFFIFYRRRAAREQYLCRFIVTAQRGNNIFAVLSSPCSAGTIFFRFIVAAQRGNDIFPFYRHRSAREQYFAILSSPCSAGTIFFRFIVAAPRSYKYICYASEKRADYPAKRQTNAA